VRRRATLVVGGGSRTEVVQKDFGHLNLGKGVGVCTSVEQILRKRYLPLGRV
jgi:hypothetical protein